MFLPPQHPRHATTPAHPSHAPTPAQVCIGNHERDVVDPSHDIPYHTIDSGGECGVPYEARFPMPTPGRRDQPWYSFDHGPVHFTVGNGCGVAEPISGGKWAAVQPAPTASTWQASRLLFATCNLPPCAWQVMSTEHHFGAGSPQRAWLEGDLAGVDRSLTPWLVLVGHRCARPGG